MSITCIKTVGKLPYRFTHFDWDVTMRTMFGCLTVTLPGSFSLFNFGNDQPAVEDRDKPWFRLNADGSPDKWWVWFNGIWVNRHPIEASDLSLRLYRGDAASVDTYDGGSAGAITETSGPMWAIDSEMEGRSPIGVGHIGGGTGTELALDQTFGEEKHTQTAAEMAAHTHDLSADKDNFTAFTTAGTNAMPVGSGYVTKAIAMQTAGESTPANIVHPVLAMYYLKRTARVYYTLAGV